MSVLELSLAAAALLIGLTGAWSPCGFSMVETVGLAGDRGRRWTTMAACATFAPGAVLGGVVTFGLLSGLGRATHGAGGRLAYLVAALIAIAAAVAEARGVRIVPQIRRQLPEGWRWTMPLPLAAGLYGILLGLGFTTFVLSFGVWALAGISVAVGDPSTGVLIGAAFGMGRSIPIVAISPVVDKPLGVRCIALMAEQPVLYRVFRLGDAVTLALVAAALTTSTAAAARVEVRNGADPSVRGKALAYQRLDRSGVLWFEGHRYGLPGKDPAVGGPFIALISGGDRIDLLDRFSRDRVASVPAPDAEAVAVSRGWLAYLAVNGRRYTLRARRINHPTHPGIARVIASVSGSAQIGHPSVDGSQVFYTVSRRRGNSIKRYRLRAGKVRTVLQSRADELLNPSAHGRQLVYVRVDRARQSPQRTRAPKLRQRMMLKRLGSSGPGRRIYSHGADRVVWSTALSDRRGYVTLFGKGPPTIVSTHR